MKKHFTNACIHIVISWRTLLQNKYFQIVEKCTVTICFSASSLHSNRQDACSGDVTRHSKPTVNCKHVNTIFVKSEESELYKGTCNINFLLNVTLQIQLLFYDDYMYRVDNKKNSMNEYIS